MRTARVSKGAGSVPRRTTGLLGEREVLAGRAEGEDDGVTCRHGDRGEDQDAARHRTFSAACFSRQVISLSSNGVRLVAG